MLNLIPGSEPFFMPGSGPNGRTGCLLIHGFTGTPFEMRGLGECLAEQGYTVYGPRLAHHGTKAADINRSRWWDWYFSALDGWHLLNSLCDQIFVIGLSMGGLTALVLAANEPVAGVVAMSAPAVYRKNKWQMKAASYVWPVIPTVKKQGRQNEEEYWPSYDDYPVRGLAELGSYLNVLENALPDVTAPALLMHALDDETVPPANLDYIYDHIASTTKKKVTVRGGHVITEDIDKVRVYQEVIDFLGETAA